MRKVLKFPFPYNESAMTLPDLKYYQPENPVVLFQRQRDVCCVWVEVCDDGWLASLTLQVFGTGHEINDPDLDHKASLQDGPYVWHLYGKIKVASV